MSSRVCWGWSCYVGVGGLSSPLWCGVVCAELLGMRSWGYGPGEGCLADMVVVVAVWLWGVTVECWLGRLGVGSAHDEGGVLA